MSVTFCSICGHGESCKWCLMRLLTEEHQEHQALQMLAGLQRGVWPRR